MCIRDSNNTAGFIGFKGYKRVSPFFISITGNKSIKYIEKPKIKGWKIVEAGWKSKNLTKSNINLKFKKYSSFRNFRPVIFLPYVTTYGRKNKYGIYNISFDPLEKQISEWFITYNKNFDIDFTYIINTFYPTMYLNFSKKNFNRGVFYSNKNLYEEAKKFGISFMVPFNFGENIYSNHTFFGGISIASRKTENKNDFLCLRKRFRPWEGNYEYFFLEYLWNKYNPDIASNINPKDGQVLNLFYRNAFKGNIKNSYFFYYFEKRVSLNYLWVLLGKFGGYFFDGDIMIQNRVSIGHPYQIRGIKSSLEGTRALFGSFELRVPVIQDLGLKLPLVYFERFILCPFFDFGKAWGKVINKSNSISFNELEFCKTAGLELRSRVYIDGKLPVVIKAGYGISLKDKNERRGYILIQPDLSPLGLGKIFRWKKRLFNQYSEF